MYASTLIFVGAEDQKVLPETQGIALHRDLSSRFIPTALYHYPGNCVVQNLSIFDLITTFLISLSIYQTKSYIWIQF